MNMKSLGLLWSMIGVLGVTGVAAANTPQKPAATVSSGTAAKPKIDAGKRADILKMMQMTGAGNLGVQVMDQMFAAMSGNMTPEQKKTLEEIRKEVNPNELVELVLPVYDKYFTQDEIREIIKFYESPVGKKTIQNMPSLMREAMEVGQRWGMSLAERVQKRMDAKKKK